MTTQHDVLVVGAGLAGLCATIHAERAGLDVLGLDSPSSNSLSRTTSDLPAPMPELVLPSAEGDRSTSALESLGSASSSPAARSAA